MCSSVKKTIKSEEEWRVLLSTEQFRVCRCKGTEAPFGGKYHDCDVRGDYHCSCCDLPLFSFRHKFDSGTGWPSFFQPLNADCIKTEEDCSQGMRRAEVHCSGCKSHLGHVFPDGPPPSGMRYCINSVSLMLSLAEYGE